MLVPTALTGLIKKTTCGRIYMQGMKNALPLLVPKRNPLWSASVVNFAVSLLLY